MSTMKDIQEQVFMSVGTVADTFQAKAERKDLIRFSTLFKSSIKIKKRRTTMTLSKEALKKIP